MVNDFLSVVGPIPDPKSFAFLPWKDRRYASIRSYCDNFRSATYYFSTSGNNANDGLTPATAKQTLAEVNNVIAASSGNITILFKRGDEWNTNTNITLNKAKITLDAYGTGNLPWINRFAQKYTTGWALAAGNRYTRTENTDTAWVRLTGWDLSKATGATQVLSRQTSSANCQATPYSFFWGTNVLHVNLGGSDPNTIPLEGNPTSTNPGIVVTADACCVKNIRVDGFGQDFSNPHNPQSYQIQWNQPADKVGYAYNCETYYGGTHLHAGFISGNGNITLVENCTAGFAMQGSAGETIFNSYSDNGLQEFYLVGCTCLAGTLPNGTGTWVRRAIPMYCHTPGSPANIGLVIVDRFTVISSNFCVSQLTYLENAPVATQTTDLRAFIIGEVATGVFLTTFPFKNIAWINCQYTVIPLNCGGQAMFASGLAAQNFTGFMWNSVIDWSLAGQTDTGSRAFYNSLSLDNNCHLYHNAFIFRTAATSAIRIDFDSGSVDSSPNCEFFNNLIESDTAAVVSVGLKNNTANLKSNAYYNIVGGADTVTRTAYGNDATKDNLSGLIDPVNRTNVAALANLGYTGIGLEYDLNYKRRMANTPGNTIAPTIGPIEVDVNLYFCCRYP